MTSPGPDELDDDLYAEILRLSGLGDEFGGGGSVPGSDRENTTTPDCFPSPRSIGASTWLLAAGRFGNPFLHLRRGEVFEQSELDAAADEFIRAYMGEGPENFRYRGPQ